MAIDSSMSTYVGLNSRVVLIFRQLRLIVVTHFEGEFREPIISVPAMKIEPNAFLHVLRIGIGR